MARVREWLPTNVSAVHGAQDCVDYVIPLRVKRFRESSQGHTKTDPLSVASCYHGK